MLEVNAISEGYGGAFATSSEAFMQVLTSGYEMLRRLATQAGHAHAGLGFSSASFFNGPQALCRIS